MTYDEYIEALIAIRYKGEPERTLGRCKEEVESMKERFPELKIIRGHIEVIWGGSWDENEGKRGHWWLETPDGEIVDPTKGQFPNIMKYTPYEEGDDIRIGKCMECGKTLWGPPGTSRNFCSVDCEDGYARYMERDRAVAKENNWRHKVFEKMTLEEFSTYLEKILSRMTPAELLAAPGAYEVFSEELNNEVLNEWLEDNKPEFPAEILGCDKECGFTRAGAGWQCTEMEGCGRYVHPTDPGYEELCKWYSYQESCEEE